MAKRVLVIGAGLAGLSAAIEAAALGYDVTVAESADHAGGKLSAWRDADGDSVEHGMHGWWLQYFNFFALMERAGILPDALAWAPPSTVVFEDGSRRNIAPFRRRYPTPVFLVLLMWRVGGLNLLDQLSGILPLSRFFAFSHRKDFERFDVESIHSYLSRYKATQRLHDFVLSPFSRSFAFTSTEELSTSAVMSALSFYLIGHQDDVRVKWCVGNPQELVIEPLVALAERLGVRFRFNLPIASLRVDTTSASPKVTGAHLVAAEAYGTVLVRLDDLEEDIPKLINVPGLGRAFVCLREAQVTAVSGTCTHQGGPLAWEADEACYRCPLHGARFSRVGLPLRDPATRPLSQFPVTVSGADVTLAGSTAQGDVLDADHIILATNVEGAKKILTASPHLLLVPQLRRVLNLEATEVIVARLWADKKLPRDLSSGVFVGLGLLDNFFVLSNLHEEFRNYDGCIIEVQMYVVKDYIHLPEEQLKQLISTGLQELLPELRGMVVKKCHIIKNYNVFTHFNVASNLNRPPTKSVCSGLYFAGDWMKLDHPWWMMEKAVTSGRLAASAIAQDDGLAPLPVHLPRPDEVFVRFVKAVYDGADAVCRGIGRFIGYKPIGSRKQ